MKPYGIITALATPMNPDETVNTLELRRQVNRMLQSGVHGIFCTGTNGEFYALSQEEKCDVLQTVVDEVKGQLPVYAGVGCATTKETVLLAQKAQELGADALSVITPYFGQASQAGLVQHFTTVAQNVDIPILLYNIPARTGNAISSKTLERLATVKNIAGIKDSSGNFDNILQYLEITGRQFPVLSGNDSLILSTLMAGGEGAVSGCANLFPTKIAEIYRLFQEGKLAQATTIQDALRPIRNCLALGNPNSVVKRLANLLGYPLGPARKPFDDLLPESEAQMRETLKCYPPEWK